MQLQAQQHAEQLVDAGSRRGRLLIKKRPSRLDSLQQAVPGSLNELRGSVPRGTVSAPQQQQQQQQSLPQAVQPPQPTGHLHQQQQQQQQAPGVQQPHSISQQSSRDKNMSFSGALRRMSSLRELLELLRSPQWGSGLTELDGVSVVGALVWLVKSQEWQQLTQQGAVGQQQWLLKQDGQECIQALLDRAEQLVVAQVAADSSTGDGNSSPHTSAANWAPAKEPAPSAAAAAAAQQPNPMLIRPAELANLVYVSSKLQQHRPQLLLAAARGLELDLYACSALELNRLIWGFAHARVNPGSTWLLNFCKAAQSKLYEGNAMQLSSLVYGVARLGYRPPDIWIAAWLEASLQHLLDFNPQQLANTSWGLSCFRFHAPPGWLAALYAASSASMDQQAPEGLSQLSVALVTLGGGEPPPAHWVQQLVDAARPLLRRMELLQLCNVGRALAQWQLVHPQESWMLAWLDASLPLLPAATPVDLSVLLWSCYRLSYVPHQRWLEAWFAAAAASLPRCEPLQLSTMALVLGEWGVVPAPGFSIDYWRATRARFPEFTLYQASVMLYGLGKARRSVPRKWATALLDSFVQQLAEADPGDVCRLVGALSRVNVKPTGSAGWVAATPAVQQQLQQLVSWVVPQMHEVQPSWLVQLVLGLVGLQCVLEVSSVQDLNDAAARMDERLDPGQRRFLARAFGQLRQAGQQQQQQQQQPAARQQRQRQAAPAGAGEWLPEQAASEVDVW